MEKRKIVVVDDEKDLAVLIKDILEGTGLYEVSLAHDGVSGLELIKSFNPELVFLDYVMPKAGGDKVIAQLKKDPAFQKLPIVVMSGLGEMVYLKNKDQWKWMPNNPGTKDRGVIPDIMKQKNSSSQIAETLGVKEFLQKPFRKETLIDIAKDYIKEKVNPEDAL